MMSVALFAATCMAQAQASRTDIPVSTPESQGFSSVDLAAALEVAHARGINIHSVTVLRNDRIVLDAYFYPYTRDMRHDVASVTKSITALLTTLAISDGYLKSTAQPIVETLPPVSVKAERINRIRIGDLLSMQSGLACGFRKGEAELVEMRKTRNWVESTLNLPIAADPGTRFGYCSPNFHLLSAAITNQTGSKHTRLRETSIVPLSHSHGHAGHPIVLVRLGRATNATWRDLGEDRAATNDASAAHSS